MMDKRLITYLFSAVQDDMATLLIGNTFFTTATTVFLGSIILMRTFIVGSFLATIILFTHTFRISVFCIAGCTNPLALPDYLVLR